MNNVEILRGVPGCGKSTWAKKHYPNAIVVSADQYFAKPDGSWEMDLSKLDKAHADCFKRFIDALQTKGRNTIIVDNTNIEAHECAPYILGAQAFGWEVIVHSFIPPQGWEAAAWFRRCWKRNTHGVPEITHIDMVQRFYEAKLPRYWTLDLIEGD